MCVVASIQRHLRPMLIVEHSTEQNLTKGGEVCAVLISKLIVHSASTKRILVKIRWDNIKSVGENIKVQRPTVS